MSHVVACKLGGNNTISLKLSNGLSIEILSQAMLAEAHAVKLARRGSFAVYVDIEQLSQYLDCVEQSSVFDALCLPPRVLPQLPTKLLHQMYQNIESCLALEQKLPREEDQYLGVVFSQHLSKGVFTITAANKIYTAIGGRKQSLVVLVAKLFKLGRLKMTRRALWLVSVDSCSEALGLQLQRYCGYKNKYEYVVDPNRLHKSLIALLEAQANWRIHYRLILHL